MHPMLNVAIQAARNAGKIIVRFVDELDSADISEKGRHDFVTKVDKLAEAEIIRIIHKAYPQHAILAEESGSLNDDDNSEYCWIIDPLDGTTNYIHGFPQFAISIALKKGTSMEVGVIYDPLRQELFTASRGQGAQLNHRKIRVSQCKKLDRALLGTGFPFRNNQHFRSYLGTFAALFPLTAGVRRAGSAALDLAYVAAGRLDGFWEISLKPWDMAAGILMITEAGGIVSDFHGDNHYLDNGNLIAGNAKMHKAICEVVSASLVE